MLLSFVTSPAYAGLTDAQNTVAFWRLFDLQKRKGSLEEVKQSLQNLSLQQDDAESLQRWAACWQQMCCQRQQHNYALVHCHAGVPS
jgi:hypothetical protein